MGTIMDEKSAEHEHSLRSWGASSAVGHLTNEQLTALTRRVKSSLRSGSELNLMTTTPNELTTQVHP